MISKTDHIISKFITTQNINNNGFKCHYEVFSNESFS